MLTIGPEPKGICVTRGEVMRWTGMTPKQWAKFSPLLQRVPLRGISRPHYYKQDIYDRVVEPMLRKYV